MKPNFGKGRGRQLHPISGESWRDGAGSEHRVRQDRSRPILCPETASVDYSVQTLDEPEDLITRSALWRRYESRLSQLLERSRMVKDTEQARHQVGEAVALAQAAITDAASADLARSECLAHMSHELRTPLSAIIGFAEVMTQGLLSPDKSREKALEYATDIKDAGHHLLALVNDILDIAKAEAGKHELKEDQLDFAELAQSCLALVRERATRSNLELDADIPESCEVLVADGRKLKQILVNLLSNAVKFTPADGKVRVIAKPLGTSGAEISVTDTGIGMTKQECDLVLEPFTQFHQDLLSDQPGTGLGLPLAKALTELHGGELQIESTPGVGTTVRLTLPRSRPAKGEATQGEREARPQPKVA